MFHGIQLLRGTGQTMLFLFLLSVMTKHTYIDAYLPKFYRYYSIDLFTNCCLRITVGQTICEQPERLIGGFVSVDLREVKEVRLGRNSKIFDKWPEDARKWDPAQCFVIFYGNTFRLKTLSCVGECLLYFI